LNIGSWLGDIRFHTNINEAMAIEGCKVHIGPTTTSARLNVATGGGVGISSTTTSSDANLVVTNDGGGDLVHGFNGGADPVFVVKNDGAVGIGTASPNDALHVQSLTCIAAGNNFYERVAPLVVGDGDGTGNAILIDGEQIESRGDGKLCINGVSTADLIVNMGGGNVGIGTQILPDKLQVAASGSQNGVVAFANTEGYAGVYGETSASVYPGGDGAAAVEGFNTLGCRGYLGYARTPSDLPVVYGVYGEAPSWGYAGYFDGRLHVTGAARVKVLHITGADLAEKFPVTEHAAPGTVMEIAPEQTGCLRIARGAYNRRVAGVMSGANDFPTGAILGNLPGDAGAPPVALAGRVWTLCDASHGSIRPGDLLTTSDIPGHAMKVTDHDRAQGAIIGKAMSSLDSGKGLVLVLVSLQ